jgi:hypothetical protein
MATIRTKSSYRFWCVLNPSEFRCRGARFFAASVTTVAPCTYLYFGEWRAVSLRHLYESALLGVLSSFRKAA